jgi:glutamate-5-semialdehyde dehydrogenase
MAEKVLLDAKTGYPAACNAVETLLVDAAIVETVFPAVARALIAKGVTLRCDEASHAALSTSLDSHSVAFVQRAEAADFDTEFLSLTLAVKTIPALGADQPFAGVDQAIEHINTHGSHHTDCILTSGSGVAGEVAERFLAAVDSAGVMHNVSTRMADGRRYGFGTEVGISTNKIHARGPVGVEGLMSYRYVIRGTGETGGDYGEGEGLKHFRHERLPLS